MKSLWMRLYQSYYTWRSNFLYRCGICYHCGWRRGKTAGVCSVCWKEFLPVVRLEL